MAAVGSSPPHSGAPRCMRVRVCFSCGFVRQVRPYVVRSCSNATADSVAWRLVWRSNLTVQAAPTQGSGRWPDGCEMKETLPRCSRYSPTSKGQLLKKVIEKKGKTLNFSVMRKTITFDATLSVSAERIMR